MMMTLTVACCIRAAEPVAFLSDISGEICLERAGKLKKVESSCEAVYPDDILVSGKDGSGKIVYDTAIFDLRPDSRYKIGDDGISRAAGGSAAGGSPVGDQAQQRGVRGNFEPVRKSGEAAAMVPAMLVAAVVPGITRAAEELPVYSPKSQVFSDDPLLFFGGANDIVYDVTLLVNEKPAGKTIKTTAQKGVPFTSFGVGKMKEDEVYSLAIRKNGKIMNDVGGSGFYLMERSERERLQKQISSLSFSSERSRMFYTANLYYKNECYAEAGLLARRLSLAEPGNRIYANLLKLSRKALGY